MSEGFVGCSVNYGVGLKKFHVLVLFLNISEEEASFKFGHEGESGGFFVAWDGNCFRNSWGELVFCEVVSEFEGIKEVYPLWLCSSEFWAHNFLSDSFCLWWEVCGSGGFLVCYVWRTIRLALNSFCDLRCSWYLCGFVAWVFLFSAICFLLSTIS